MGLTLVYLNQELMRKLLALRNTYKHEDVGETIRLALMVYLWYIEKRKVGRAVGAMLEKEKMFLTFETDYQALALYISGEVTIEIESDEDAVRDIKYVVEASGSENASTVIAEAIFFLGDVTELIRGGHILIANDPVRNTFLQFIHPNLEMLRTEPL